MTINLIPMAGEGKRYIDAGYTIPKPFLSVDGLPMIVRAGLALPVADRNIFVCRKSHIESYPIHELLKAHFKDPIIIEIDQLTEGQAITCLMAKEFIPDDAILTIGASDNDMTYSKNQFDEFLKDESIDGLIWTFRNNPSVLQNPNMYGWVKVDGESLLADAVSCKKAISTDPLNDHAVIGAFTFKKAVHFFNAVETMVFENKRINNEFYVDIAADYCIKAGNSIKPFEVEQYICWGTPQDYLIYNNWLQYFKKRIK